MVHVEERVGRAVEELEVGVLAVLAPNRRRLSNVCVCVCVCVCACVCVRERETEKETERKGQKERETAR